MNEDSITTEAPLSILSTSILTVLDKDHASTHLYHQNLTSDVGEEHSKLTIVILATLYTLIFFIGITGNSLVVYVVCVKKSMQSVTNLFIMNLALSDILMCLLAVPFTPISFFQDYWTLGKFLCHLVPFSLGVSVYVSTLTSLAIAIDRYFVIVHPFKPRMKLGVCCLLIAVVWIVSISISLPLAIYMDFKPVNVNGQIQSTCRESWPIPMSRRFFNLASMVLQYLIPFTVITYSYIKVWIILSNRTRPGKTKEKEQLELKRKKRTNRMLIAMVLIFAGCWMPLNCVYLIMEFNSGFTKQSYFSSVFFITHVIAMSSTIYNPFLYAWLNDNFRKEFRLILPWIFKAVKWCSKSDMDTNEDDELNFERSKFLNNGNNNNSSIYNNNNANNQSNNQNSPNINQKILLLDDGPKLKTSVSLNLNNSTSNKPNINSLSNPISNKSLLKSSNKSKVIDEFNQDSTDDCCNRMIKEENNVTFADGSLNHQK